MAQLPKHRVELIGKGVTGACIALVALLVVTLVAMVAQRGIATFAVDGIDLGAFLTGTTWNPHQDDVNGMPTVGALPMISGSFAVTLLSTLFALPIAIGSAIFVVEIAPRFGRRVFQPLIELLVGIPSVVYGLIGLTVVVAWTRDMRGRGWSNHHRFRHLLECNRARRDDSPHDHEPLDRCTCCGA